MVTYLRSSSATVAARLESRSAEKPRGGPGRAAMSAKGGKWLNPFCTDIDTFSSHLSQTCPNKQGRSEMILYSSPFSSGCSASGAIGGSGLEMYFTTLRTLGILFATMASGRKALAIEWYRHDATEGCSKYFGSRPCQGGPHLSHLCLLLAGHLCPRQRAVLGSLAGI